MATVKEEVDRLVAEKALMMCRFAMGRLTKEDYSIYNERMPKIDDRLKELRRIIEAGQ